MIPRRLLYQSNAWVFQTSFIEHGNVNELMAEIGMTAGHIVDLMETFVREQASEREQV